MNTALHTYWSSLDPIGKHSFAHRSKVRYVYMSNVANGHKRISPDMALRMEAASDGALRVETLCPGLDWHVIRQAA